MEILGLLHPPFVSISLDQKEEEVKLWTRGDEWGILVDHDAHRDVQQKR